MAKGKVKEAVKAEVKEETKTSKSFAIDHFLTQKDVSECPETHDEYVVTDEIMAFLPSLTEIGLKVGDKFFYPRGK